jgi:hypothetical protein
MNWIDKKAPKTKGQVGRPPLSDIERRVQIRPTVSRASKEWLESQNEATGRTIDKLIAIYQMRQK